MSILKLIEKLLPLQELYATLQRFPLSVFCALSLFFIGVLATHDIIDDNDEWILRLAAILGCCYFWFGISKLMSESQNWNVSKYVVVSFVIAASIAAIFSLSSVWGIHLIFVLPSLLLCLMVAPYLTSGDDISVWFFNRMMWFGVLVSYAALIMFAGGLSVALVAIHTLFDMKIESEIYEDIWLFASLVLGPVYALSWVPKEFEFTKEDCNDPPGLKFIVNWIFAPMVFVYLLILYAYFTKILMTGDVPNGYLAFMITGFAGAGIVTYLVAWPLREEGSIQLKLFYKVFFPALLIPVVFHFYAIWERISEYGVTEQRYLILVSAVWFALVSITNSFQKIPIKAIPMTLAILMIFASFGPWGGVSVSGYSQYSRLKGLLTVNNLIVDGKVVKAKENISFKDRQSISSILDYLCSSERDSMIESWFNTENKKDWVCTGGYNLTEQLGFDYVSRYSTSANNERFYLNSPRKNYIDISLYDMLIKNISVYNSQTDNDKEWSSEWNLEDGQTVEIEYSRAILSIYIDTYKAIKIDVRDFAAKKIPLRDNMQDLIIETENEDISFLINFYSMGGGIKDGQPVIGNMNFDFLYRIKK